MYKVFILVLGLLGLLHNAVGQIIQNGSCEPDSQLADNFEYEQFLGRWYEHHVSDSESGDCSYYEFERLGNSSYTVSRNSVNENFERVLKGTGFVENGTAKLTLDWEGSSIPEDFWVSYVLTYVTPGIAVTYKCVDISPQQKSISLWVLSKSTAPLTQSFVDFISTHLTTNFNVTLDSLRGVSHSENACYRLPSIAPGNPIILTGQCESLSVVQNFNVANFTGVWHEIASYYSENSENQCSRAQYTLDGGVVNIVNSQVLNQKLATITGTAVVASTDGSAKLNVTLNVESGVAEQDLWILATDYSSYAISYTCINLSNDTRRVHSWILSRTRQLSASAQVAVDDRVASEIVLNTQYYQNADQSDDACFFYPDLVPGVPVVFRGSCNESIPVVQNFNATLYMGTWYDIESYPSIFQTGKCKNANYALGAVIDVFNTQVINQTLDTMRGFAIPVAEDGSAKLEVSFPIAGLNATTSTNYWVLDTDYTSYALVYSCVDVPATEESQVWSWKLSRTKQLTPAAASAINNTMENIPVLDQRYFEPVDQSPRGCFYYPEPQPGVPVLFPGICGDSVIDVVQNFDLNRFDGVWYEIEAYPKDQQQGQCVRHQYTNNSDTLSLQSTQVVDQYLRVSNSTLGFSNSSDTSARLTITLDSGIEIPFWILSVDYDDYALAYSCVDRGDDFRAVYSWKLSRTKQLSPNADTAINSAVSTVQVLSQDYYEPVDQSEAACFYLPELAEGELVILSGQCNPNITVVANFNAARYLGRWRLIESYASEFQNGTCNEATYSLNNDSTVDVFNTQVFNQTLYTINGYATVEDNAKLLVYFPEADSPSEYWILDTDYDSYALVYSCRNLNTETKQVWSWKMSRSKSLTPQAMTAINKTMDTVNELFQPYYKLVDHSDEECFFFPPSDLTTPVKFRGTCDQSIAVMPNFNVTRYLGLWHNIELYPSVFQGGSCNNAFYSAAADGVDVFNTQVLEQKLDTMTGFAVVASTDGSAKLNVTFPIVGTNLNITTNYWVLDTDYDSYSLVYTCEDLDDEQRLVYSWKLSRTKELTAPAEIAINNSIRDIQVLDNSYYRKVDQGPEGCFFYPEPEPGRPVTFPGKCDNTINATSNFNLTRFQGVWYEIQAYPKAQVQGDCSSHEYSAHNATSLTLQSSQVYNQSLIVSSGLLSLASGDNSGKLTIDINVSGTDITIPFWILSTDYDSYAVAYSCVDNPDETRTVYSWKLSRSKELSPNANTAINETIEAIDVLQEQYFENIDQSDSACFYVPVLAPGEMVVFPGQCDTNITVVQNFRAADYLGRWRLIESYQSDFQNGLCSQATYSLKPNGAVDVFNTQVINEKLYTITGEAIVDSDDGSGKLLVTFPDAPENATYWILATDYVSYSLVYSCRNINKEQRQVWAWKMSREKELSQNAINEMNAVINNVNVLNDRFFEDVPQSQEACFYYPEPNGQTVRFRGRCNESIDVVQDFNPENYSGTWYDIESYPQTFQDGTCPKAEYSISGGVVVVFNTQVVNQQLDTIYATAVPSSNDGSGKLDVTFPIAGTNLTVTTPYWVLATNYTDFSLVYSCVNLDDEYYRVTSWKLSRTLELSSASIEAFENVKSVVPELRDQYYERNSHSEEDCFFYPDNNGGPVYLDGQCEEPSDVEVITNFDASRFSNTWYEINRFPSDLQNGECAATRYNYNQTFDITNTIVNNEKIYTFTGQGTLADRTKGVLDVNLNNGGYREYVFILDTDYDEYALLYSCKNVDAQRKQVFSWKLSRNQAGFSPAAISSMDSIVTNRTYLFENYYTPTRQDSNSCFHYPEFDGTQSSIILPGICDQSIRGVENFRAEDYIGQWYEIYSYPDPNQFGQCARAHYAVGNDVAITNTQVVNRTLLTQEGSAMAAADGSGQLLVTFVVNGETKTANYYVISTDYNNYALVYSCRDVDDNSREVFSWKLSRTSTLSTAANTAMDQAIATTQGLLNDYYRPISQTPGDCFYVPEFSPNESPLFRGRCGTLAPVIESFEPQRYLNKWWHEIERYPTDSNDGECVSTRYQATGNTFADTRIFGVNDGRVATGTVTATANGQIIKAFSDGSTETLWVVATDYDTYALLLSCEDVGDEYIRVWSTKHSSTRNLTTAAENALASVIESNDLLYQEFYQTVSQSDASCFYYPEQDGQRVILPGQCDKNIPTQSNFDLTSYIGTWYQIERYPYPEVRANSTCIGTRYTLRDGDNVVNVLNWETNGDGLETITGVGTWTNGSAIITVALQTDPEDEEAIVTTDLYILLTDYVSFSLAYTCRNIDAYNRVVVALKLSRTRGLPAPATTSINNHMGSRQELNQAYFLQVAHDEECEDPSSSFLVKSSVIVTLICLIIQTFM